MKFHRLRDYCPMFPDGRFVGEGQLGEWLEAIRDCPDIPGRALPVAEGIVALIRRRMN